MSNVVYLKSVLHFYAEYVCFNKDNLSVIRVDNDCAGFNTYNDLESFELNLSMAYSNEYKNCNKSEFDEALNNFKNNLNLLSEKL